MNLYKCTLIIEWKSTFTNLTHIVKECYHYGMYAFDIDGVISNSYPHMVRSVENFIGTPFEEPMRYDVFKSYSNSISREDFYKIFDDLVTNHVFTPYEGSVEVLQEYYKKEKRLVFITHRHNHLNRHTREWIRTHINLPYELYVCSSCDKSFVAKDVDVTGFFDDVPSICRNFFENGLVAYLMEAPWHVYEDVSGIPKVTSWEDIGKIIL